MFAVDQPPQLPEYRDFISAGTYLLGVLIVAMTPVIVTLINRRTKQAEERAKQRELKAAKEVRERAEAAAEEVKQALQDHPTSNGFTGRVDEALAEIRKSIGAMHGRFDKYESHMDEWMIGIDDRLIHIEEGADNGRANDSTQDAAGS